jgi:hypothetical protein
MGFQTNLEKCLRALQKSVRPDLPEIYARARGLLDQCFNLWFYLMGLEDAGANNPTDYTKDIAYQLVLAPVAGSIRRTLGELYTGRLKQDDGTLVLGRAIARAYDCIDRLAN